LEEKIYLGNEGLKDYEVEPIGIDYNYLDATYKYLYYPKEIFKPNIFGKKYKDGDAIRLLYDMREYSKINREYDSKALLSNSERKGEIVETEVINVLVPGAFSLVLPTKVGQATSLCIGRQKAQGQQEKCKLRFQARIVGFVNKMPGLLKFTGYMPTIYNSPNIMLSKD